MARSVWIVKDECKMLCSVSNLVCRCFRQERFDYPCTWVQLLPFYRVLKFCQTRLDIMLLFKMTVLAVGGGLSVALRFSILKINFGPLRKANGYANRMFVLIFSSVGCGKYDGCSHFLAVFNIFHTFCCSGLNDFIESFLHNFYCKDKSFTWGCAFDEGPGFVPAILAGRLFQIFLIPKGTCSALPPSLELGHWPSHCSFLRTAIHQRICKMVIYERMHELLALGGARDLARV